MKLLFETGILKNVQSGMKRFLKEHRYIKYSVRGQTSSKAYLEHTHGLHVICDDKICYT